MADKNISYFFLILLIIVTYFLYEKTKECEKLYKICREQDDTIYLQSSAIAKQTLYINLLNSKDYKNPMYSPVH